MLFSQSALVESDARCDELEAKTKLLEGQVSDLQGQLTQQSAADEHVVSLVQMKAKEWEVSLVGGNMSSYKNWLSVFLFKHTPCCVLL